MLAGAEPIMKAMKATRGSASADAAMKKGGVRRRPSAPAGVEEEKVKQARRAMKSSANVKKRPGPNRATSATKAATQGPTIIGSGETGGEATGDLALDKLLWDIAEEVGATPRQRDVSTAAEKSKKRKVEELKERYAMYRSDHE